jgi:group I intron endonuclease
MFQAYTYYLYHIPTGKKYYGARWANRCEPEQDLWVKYFGSSDLVDSLIEEYGKDSFIAEVRKKFDKAEDARDYENRVLRKLNVIKNPEWLNQGYMSGSCCYGNWNGRKHREDSKEKMRVANIGENNPMYGKTHTPENREKIRQSKLGEKNPMHGISLSGDRNGMYGKKHSLERNKTHSEFMKEYWRKKKLGLSQSDPSNTK